MNYLITYKCPKCCSFCFFPELSKTHHAEMSLDTFVECFTHARKLGSDSRVALLGGEPTIAKHFQDICRYMYQKQAYADSFVIFSNLFGTDNIRWLCDQPKFFIDTLLVWNNSELFLKSDDIIAAVMANATRVINSKWFTDIIYSLTINKNTTKEGLQYLLRCKDAFGAKSIRMAIDSQWQNISIIQSSTIVDIILYLADKGFVMHNDGCGFLSPSFFTKQQIDLVNSVIAGDVKTGCSGMVGDILPDGTIVPCMPWIDAPSRMKFTDATSLADMQLYYQTKPSGFRGCPAAQSKACFLGEVHDYLGS